MLKNFFVILYSIFINFCVFNQNNAIFIGGNGSGSDVLCYSQADVILNNSIFAGGNSSGEDVLCYSQADVILNNSIFVGGNSSGEDVLCYSQADVILNNSIFAGGNSSGTDVLCYSQADVILNNSIFAGGFASGSNIICRGTSEEIPLPLQLLFLNANIENNVVNLMWATETEINNDFFIVEKSRDGFLWDYLIEVPGAGNSFSIKNYNTKDTNPYYGISYYRLKFTNFDGNYKYSNIVSVDYNNQNKKNIVIYPNPTKDIIYLLMSNNEDYEVQITDNVGSLIYKDKNPFQISLNSFSDGIYYVKIIFNDETTYTSKLIIKK